SRVGRVVSDAARWHVCLRPLGRLAKAATPGARSHGNQAALLPPLRAHFYLCVRSPNFFADRTSTAKDRSRRRFELPGIRLRVRAMDNRGRSEGPSPRARAHSGKRIGKQPRVLESAAVFCPQRRGAEIVERIGE